LPTAFLITVLSTSTQTSVLSTLLFLALAATQWLTIILTTT
jgi:hypothetical protein